MSNVHEPILNSWQNYSPSFEKELKTLFQKSFFDNNLFDNPIKEITIGSDKLAEAIHYALFSGGKRFRPLLVYASCKVLEKDFEIALPWAMAVECIHTYSLIHDDLPCMDNDDERRGKPTVHKKFDEATALLAGDALLTEAFGILGKYYSGHKNLGQLIQLLSKRSGYQGMVSGQANDLNSENEMNTKKISGSNLEQRRILFTHLQKTAALIGASSLGPFLILDIDKIITEKFNNLSLIIGILFQLKDDILDSKEKTENNLVQKVGLKESEAIYNNYKNMAKLIVSDLSANLNLMPYQELIDYNDERLI